MRRPLTFICLFCEDIRDERSGQDTMIGIMPDNLTVGQIPAVIPKLGVYFRIQLEKDDNPRSIKLKLRLPGGGELQMGSLDAIISQAKAEAETNEMPFAGLIARGVLSPVPISSPGKIEAIVEIDGTEYVCGALRLRKGEVPTPLQFTVHNPT
jgi:Family of unknown function (DUF6941)